MIVYFTYATSCSTWIYKNITFSLIYISQISSTRKVPIFTSSTCVIHCWHCSSSLTIVWNQVAYSSTCHFGILSPFGYCFFFADWESLSSVMGSNNWGDCLLNLILLCFHKWMDFNTYCTEYFYLLRFSYYPFHLKNWFSNLGCWCNRCGCTSLNYYTFWSNK